MYHIASALLLSAAMTVATSVLAAAESFDDQLPPVTIGGNLIEGDEAAIAPEPTALAMVEQRRGRPTEASLPDPGIVVQHPPVQDDICMQELRRCCCPQWPNYFVFDALLLQRDNSASNAPIVIGSSVSPTPGATLLTAQSMQFPVAGGTRLLYGHRGRNNLGWEVGYLGVYGMSANAITASPDAESVPGDLGQTVPGWSTADIVGGTYQSALNIAEANVFLYDCCMDSDPCAACPCKRRCNCRCTDLLAGFFWAGLDETAALGVVCCPGDPASYYTVNTSSNLFGGQLGVRRRRDWNRWGLEGTAKAGLAGTNLYQSSGPITSTLSPGAVFREPTSASATGVGFLSTLNLTGIYRLTDHWGLRAGYNLIWLSGVALAPSQWDFTDTATSGTSLAGGGSLFLHGVNVGAERRW